MDDGHTIRAITYVERNPLPECVSERLPKTENRPVPASSSKQCGITLQGDLHQLTPRPHAQLVEQTAQD